MTLNRGVAAKRMVTRRIALRPRADSLEGVSRGNQIVICALSMLAYHAAAFLAAAENQ